MYTKEDIINLVEEYDVKFVRLQFTDIMGNFKNVSVTVSQLMRALDGKCMFDGSSIEGFVRIEESDMYLKPDLDTFVILPWRPQHGRVCRFICDICRSDGTLFEGSPRYVLKKAIERAEKMGYKCKIAPECEFFLFQTTDSGEPTVVPSDRGSYFDIGPVDMGENTRREICLTLEDMGFEILSSHHEQAPGQHEIDFRAEDALKAADNVMTLKMVVKTIAQRNGHFASFMPKPLNDCNGSGMHINVYCEKDGRNAFEDEEDPNGIGLSETAYNFLGGVTAHMKGLSLVTNPLVNSYKRITNGFDAPNYIAWAFGNRSPLIRIPAGTGEKRKIELRSPDASANPYLAFAAIICAGLDGVENKLTPPDYVNGNIYDLDDDTLKRLGIQSLPKSLGEAIDEFEKDDVIKSALGEHVAFKYVQNKKGELEEYCKNVTDWEIKKYLNIY